MVSNEIRMNPNHHSIAYVLLEEGYDTAYINKMALSNAEQKMREGPSGPLYRRRLQTTLSCCG
ncbi:hypothetical protein PAECIP111802_02534 [Paenibacillus allorhizosphaerae]|uniref:Uncharacterized protein n=2 Tax=Paenibacillus allorhizosphaerae TaxID=2849866 RepID=A0ABN7TJM9_9BACL|nr:hypothetical protein PAECIP111802_02534 [Paenibacillus allorhizosphaerae]